MGKLFSLISKNPLFNPDMAMGYTDDEIRKIERLYEISVRGMLHDYLSDFGRCDGGTPCGSLMVMHRMLKPAHFLTYSLELEQEMWIDGLEHYIQRKPFFLSSENESIWTYFVLTDSDTPDKVFCYDSYHKAIYDRGMTLFDYVKFWTFEHEHVDRYIKNALERNPMRYWVGEIIDFDRTGKRPN